MLFNVPVVPDEDLARVLNDHAASLHSCYFSLHAPQIHDGRLQRRFVDTTQWIEFLSSLHVPRKYLLMNSRVHGYEAYFDQDQIQRVVQTLEGMLVAGVIDGVVFADAYYLQALSDAGPDVASQLEAIPSINHMLSSFERVASVMDFIASTHFAPPGALILDRSLNRRLDALTEIATRFRETAPGIGIELLANEGCLDHCPFKLTHDCQISLVNMGLDLDTHVVNRELGCQRTVQRSPALLFRSPFIRPEDVGAYEQTADVLKLCGRTLGARFILNVLNAYASRHFAGNLLELMDAMEPTAQWLHVSNEDLPQEFFQRLSSCSRDCRRCTYCEDLLRTCARPREARLQAR
jgi:collagenase-like PrtC family protease